MKRSEKKNNCISLESKYNWQFKRLGTICVFFVGREKSISGIVNMLPQKGGLDEESVWKKLAESKGHFAFIADGPEWLMAATDKVRSYPLFYVKGRDQFQISNSARLLKEKCDLNEVDEVSRLEMHMAGYVTGRETVFRHLYQIQAGESLIWEKRKRKLQRKRYFLFYSDNVREEKKDNLLQELDEITNSIIRRVMEDAGGRPIWVSLSGGLDSRLVLCKLKELGYDNLWSFSYGPPNNYEAKAARYVSEKIGVPWTFVPSLRKEARSYFWTNKRAQYWEYADGLHVAPNLHSMYALRVLVDKKNIDEQNAIIINGQSGDFITGAHIPLIEDNEATAGCLYDKIMQKHYSLKRTLLNDRSNRELIIEKINRVLAIKVIVDTKQKFAKAYELWEWQERQCKRVINGQRNYDYFGLKWELPLWEVEYLRFWMEVPLKLKLKRSLFRDYLEKRDLFGLFSSFRPRLSRWPGKLHNIQYIMGGTINALFGADAAGHYHRCLDYFSHDRYLYAHLSYPDFLKKCTAYKSALSYFVDVWEKECKI